ARADLFALGAVMHEALTGRRVFTGANAVATLMNVLEKPGDPPSTINAGVSKQLDWIVMRALRRDPRQRFSSAAQMARALESHVRSEPSPTPPVQALQEFMREFIPRPARRPPPIPASARAARADDATMAIDDAEILAMLPAQGQAQATTGSQAHAPPPVPTAVRARPSAWWRRRR